ncbi:hypothetical protein BTHI11S_04691 [Bosea thiooxidans]
MHDAQRVVHPALMQRRERAPGAADGVEVPPLHGAELRQLVELFLDDLLGHLERALRAIEQCEAAERHAGTLPHGTVADRDQLQAAAAEVADDTVRGIETGDHAEAREHGLAAAGDQLDRLADRPLGPGDEIGPVLGIARRRRGDDAKLADMHRLAEDAEAHQRVDRLLDRVLGEAAGRGDLPAETGHLLLVEDLRRRARQHLVDDETHGVRADIDDGDRVRERQAPRRVPELRPCGRPAA